MADDKTNHAGDMVINLSGSRGAHMDCGCHGRCGCGHYSHGHGHDDGGGHVNISKRVNNVIYGTPCCDDEPADTTPEPAADTFLAAVSPVDENGIVTFTMNDGTAWAIDFSSFTDMFPTLVFDNDTITGSGTPEDPYVAVVDDDGGTVITDDTIVGSGTTEDPYRIVGYDLPRGVQDYDISVTGTYDTPLGGATAAPSAKLEASFNDPDPAIRYYTVIPGVQQKVLTVADYPGLADAGQTLELLFQDQIGYILNTANAVPNQLAYQYGVALFVDGALVQQTRDNYGLNNSGYWNFVNSLQRATVDTTGGDMTIEMCPFIRVNTASPQYDATDVLRVDTIEGMIQYDVVI